MFRFIAFTIMSACLVCGFSPSAIAASECEEAASRTAAIVLTAIRKVTGELPLETARAVRNMLTDKGLSHPFPVRSPENLGATVAIKRIFAKLSSEDDLQKFRGEILAQLTAKEREFFQSEGALPPPEADKETSTPDEIAHSFLGMLNWLQSSGRGTIEYMIAVRLLIELDRPVNYALSIDPAKFPEVSFLGVRTMTLQSLIKNVDSILSKMTKESWQIARAALLLEYERIKIIPIEQLDPKYNERLNFYRLN